MKVFGGVGRLFWGIMFVLFFVCIIVVNIIRGEELKIDFNFKWRVFS